MPTDPRNCSANQPGDLDCRWWFAAAGFACLLIVPGCSGKKIPPWGTARGKVLVGSEAPQGTVIFANQELGVARVAEIEADGRFVFKSAGYAGLPVGVYQVAFSPLGVSKGDFVPVAKPAKGSPDSAIPDRFRNVDTSGLTAEVKEGENPPFEFQLKRD